MGGRCGVAVDSPVGSHSLSSRANQKRVLEVQRVEAHRTNTAPAGPQSPKAKPATITEQVTASWRRLGGRLRKRVRSPGVSWEQRLDRLEARIEHLEAALEGLQDAVYRQAVVEDEHIGELRRRTEPDQMARDLSEHARQRGL